jgi:hypothetical protein
MTTIIEADPSKNFFISMLTRDISLISSIVDLIDIQCRCRPHPRKC